MITILPEKTSDGGSFSFCENGAKLASCGYKVNGWKGEITSLSAVPGCGKNIKEAVVRAVLNSLDMKGVTDVRCEDRELGEFLISIGFDIKDGCVSVDTSEFFSRGCSGEKTL